MPLKNKRKWVAIDVTNTEEGNNRKQARDNKATLKNESLFFVDIKGKALSRSQRKILTKQLLGVPLSKSEVKGTCINTKLAFSAIKPCWKKQKLLKKVKKKCNNSENYLKITQNSADDNFCEESSVDLWNESKFSIKKALTNGNMSAIVALKDIKAAIEVPKKKVDPHNKRKQTQIPHAGASFNPLKQDHQVALRKAYEHHITSKKTEEDSKSKLEILWKSGIIQDEDEAKDDEDNEAPLLTSILTKKNKNRRTRIQKNRKRRYREASFKRRDKFRNKSLRKEINQISTIVAEFEQSQTYQAECTAEKQKLREVRKALVQPRLGKLKCKELFSEMSMTRDLTTSMRKMKPAGSLLNDAFKYI